VRVRPGMEIAWAEAESQRKTESARAKQTEGEFAGFAAGWCGDAMEAAEKYAEQLDNDKSPADGLVAIMDWASERGIATAQLKAAVHIVIRFHPRGDEVKAAL